MIMHSHGSRRQRRTFTGSTAKQPKAEDYPPEGLHALDKYDSF